MKNLVKIFAITLLFAGIAPRTASALEPEQKKAAAEQFQRGKTLYDMSQFSDALEAFRAGYELAPLPGFLVNIGQCERKLGRLDSAAATFEKYLASEGTNPRLRGEVSEALSEIKSEISRRENEARARRDEEERKKVVNADDDARPNLRLSADSSVANTNTAGDVSMAPAKKKSRWWVWTLVGVGAAGLAAGAVAIAVVYAQPSQPTPGSLGLVDGRR